MKKTVLISAAFFGAVFTVNAQITVTSANYNAVTAAGMNQKVDTLPVAGIVPGSAGASQTYNFSALNSHLTSVSTFTTVAAGVLGSTYSVTSADVCMKQDTMYFYFDSSSTKLDMWGVAGNLLQNGVNNAMVYSNPQTVITFPSTYNTAFTDVATYDNTFNYGALYQGYNMVDSVREKETITTTSKIDGWGTVTTPNATFNCLRQNIKKHSVDSTWAKVVIGTFHYWLNLSGDTSNTQSYSYISTNGGPIVDIEYYADSSKIYQVRWNTTLDIAVPQYEAENDITVFPNPVSDNLIINNSSMENLNAIIYDLSGREVLNATISGQKKIISVGTIENGIYLLRVFNKTGLVKSNKIAIIK